MKGSDLSFSPEKEGQKNFIELKGKHAMLLKNDESIIY